MFCPALQLYLASAATPPEEPGPPYLSADPTCARQDLPLSSGCSNVAAAGPSIQLKTRPISPRSPRPSGRDSANAILSCSHLYRRSCVSHHSRRASKSLLGRLRFRGGAGVLGTQVALIYTHVSVRAPLVHVVRVRRGLVRTFVQFEQGLSLLHFFFRCWHRTHERVLFCVADVWEVVGGILKWRRSFCISSASTS